MIESAENFIKLRSSRTKSEYDRSATEEASLEVWYDIIRRYPEYRRWVIHNKAVPLSILEHLYDIDPSIRVFLARKRKLSLALFERLAQDSDPIVRGIISINKKTPKHVLEMLIRDNDKEISESAKLNHSKRHLNN